MSDETSDEETRPEFNETFARMVAVMEAQAERHGREVSGFLMDVPAGEMRTLLGRHAKMLRKAAQEKGPAQRRVIEAVATTCIEWAARITDDTLIYQLRPADWLEAFPRPDLDLWAEDGDDDGETDS